MKSKFDRFDPTLKKLMEQMVSIDAEDRPTAAGVAKKLGDMLKKLHKKKSDATAN